MAGNYAVAYAQGTSTEDAETALAVPRIELPGAAGVALPQPLAPSDAVRVRRIFALQGGGAITAAVRETERLESGLLTGAILSDRYLGGRYQPTPTELDAWLTRFADQPEAPAVRGLLDRMAPRSDNPAPIAGGQRSRGTAGATRTRLLFTQNRDGEAIVSVDADAPESVFVGGLAAWRLDRPTAAGSLFEHAYRVAPTAALRSAAAYWAARSDQRRQQRSSAIAWMRLAARESPTFYGRIARRALGPPVACEPGQTLGSADVDALLARPPGERAFALLQVGQRQRAEVELQGLWLDTGQDPAFARLLAVLARALEMPRLAAAVAAGHRAPPPAWAATDAGGIPALRPDGGFTIDPPLVYALVRNESNFQPMVVSSSGAQGLMQLMPTTARAVAGAQAARLRDPGVNLAVGQRYLLALAEDASVNGDLLRVLAGYTEGLYGLKRWADEVRDDGEPLLFLEAIPNPRTRVFVQEALGHSWSYATALGLAASSLDALAAAHYPRLTRAARSKGESNGALAACVPSSAWR